MKTKLIIMAGLLCMALPFNGLAEAKKMVKSELKEATVFFNGAELTHTVTVSLQKGDNELKIMGLSPYIDANSIKIKTTNGALVSSFEFAAETLPDEKAKSDSIEIQKIDDAITALQRELGEVASRKKVNTDMLAILQKSVIKNVEGSENGLEIDDLMKTLDYFNNKSLEAEAQIRKDKEREAEIGREITKLNTKRAQRTHKAAVISGILKLNLAAQAAADSKITVSYFTAYAGWIPYYDISVASTDKPIKFTTKAKVRQQTGTDWEKVKLTLSTAQPSSGKVAPLFRAWFLSFYNPPVPVSTRAMQNSFSYDRKMKISEVPAEADDDYYIQEEMEAALTPTMDNYVVQSENQLNISFDIDIPYSIPGSGKEMTIELKNQNVPADFKYYCAPRLDAETFVLAEIDDWQKLNLLSGKANITYDGTYVGETYIDAASTNEKLALTLGTDRRVPVKREKQQDYSSSKIFGSDMKQEFVFKLTVRNNQNVPVKMVLKDQYPKSTIKEISVEYLEKQTTKPDFHIEDLGVITWEFELKPGESREFKMAYSVKYPKNRKLNL